MPNVQNISDAKRYISDLALQLKLLAEKEGDIMLAVLFEMAAMQALQPVDERQTTPTKN